MKKQRLGQISPWRSLAHSRLKQQCQKIPFSVLSSKLNRLRPRELMGEAVVLLSLLYLLVEVAGGTRVIRISLAGLAADGLDSPQRNHAEPDSRKQ